MPKLYDRQANEWRDIADHLVEDAYKSGRFLFKKGAEVNIQLPDGRYGTVPAEKLGDALQAGATYDLAVDRQERIEQAEYGGKERELEALFLAAGRGLTFGLSDVAAEKFGDYSEEELRKLEEYNPTISAVGEIGGAVLPAFFTGGTSTAAKILSGASAFTPAGQAARAGIATEKAVAGAIGLDKATTVADKMLKGGASLGAAAGIEGVLFGAGETFSEELLGRADRTAEQMLANIGSVGLLSGGIGTALGAGPGALTKAFQAFHGNRFSKGLGDKVAQFSDDLTAAMTSGDRATIAKFRDPEFLDRYIGFDSIKSKTQNDTVEYLNGFVKDLEDATRMASGSTKAARMEDLAGSENATATIQGSIDALVAVKKSLETMLDDPVAYKAAQEKAGDLMGAVDLQLKKMGEAIEAHLKDSGQLPKGGKVVLENGSFAIRTKEYKVGAATSKEVDIDTPLGDLSEKDRLARAADAERKFAEEGERIGKSQAELRSDIENIQAHFDDNRIAPEFLEEARNDLARFKKELSESEAAAAVRGAPEITAIPTDWGKLPATIFNQLDEFKKVVGTYAYKTRPTGKVSFNANAEMDTLYQSLRNVLEDESLFGAAAKAQEAVNAPFHKLLKNATRFQKRFLVKDGDKYVANPGKVATFIKRSDDFDERAALDKDAFEDTVKSFQEFINAAKGSYGDDFSRFARNTEAINKQWADFGELLAAQKELRHLSQTNDSSMSLLAGGAAYAIGGIPGAVVAAAANDIIRPGNAIRRRMVVHNMKSMMTKRIDKSVSRVTDRIMKNKAGGPQRASKVPSILALVGVKSTGDSNEDIAAEMQAIQQVSAPDALTARIEKGTADLEDAPIIREELTNATIRQIGMLRDAAAKGAIVETDPLTGQQKIVMSDSGKGEYREVRDTLADPVGNSTQALEDGTASRTMGQTFAQAFPILFQEYVEKLLSGIREEAEKTGIALAFADTMQLSNFTGIPLSPTLNPGFIGAMQNVMKATDQGRRPQRRVASLKESANRAILPVEQAIT